MKDEGSSKVKAAHLTRIAYLYVRQSTLQQVFENTESTKRQYALRQRALALGWSPEQVKVIDRDLGQSGASAADREGFQEIVTEVGMGRAGIVMGLEVSRLARNSTDWHRLLEMCALSDTLILDEDGLYDPSHFNDRLLLGLKGAMSEAELHMLRARLQGGLLNKARRGELEIRLPTGFIYDENGETILDPDAQVQESIRHFFETFLRTGTASGVVREFEDKKLRFPTRPFHGPNKGELVWQRLGYTRALRMLHNVRYAGAYAYGQTRQRKSGDGRHHTKALSRDQWEVFIQKAHEGYISWETFEENQRRLKDNAQNFDGDGKASPPRDGPALLQGLVICGICGNRMATIYHMRQSRLAPNYICQRSALRWKKSQCQRFTGTMLDEAVALLLLEIMTPRSLEISLEVLQELQERVDQADQIRYRGVERARYEAEQARKRYMKVNPENRLAADALEATWNAKLRSLAEAEERYERHREIDQAVLGKEQQDCIMSLANDFPRLWKAATTSDRDRKRMARLLIEDITVIREESQIIANIRFRGGKRSTLSVARALPSWKQRLTPKEVVAEIDRLLDDHSRDEIINILNARGIRSGEEQTFNRSILKNLCTRYRLKSRKERLRERGMLTAGELAALVGVRPMTIYRWRREGFLKAHPCGGKPEYLFERPSDAVNLRQDHQNWQENAMESQMFSTDQSGAV